MSGGDLGRFRARFARTPEDVEAAQRLRYEVFNRELGEGLAESEAAELDRDRFDAQCEHLLVENSETGDVVGTYRLQTLGSARRGHGFYTDGEFDLSGWPTEVMDQATEIGRACVAREHRRGPVLLLLWQGLAAYALHHRKRYFFGCSSLTSQDPAEAARALEWLKQRGHWTDGLPAEPRAGFDCGEADLATDGWEDVRLPTLFRTYLRYGAQICGRPAIDREFGTIDFLTLLDLQRLGPAKILGRMAGDLRGDDAVDVNGRGVE